MKNLKIFTFQDLIKSLQKFWCEQGCFKINSLDIEIGAGTLHPINFLFGIANNNFSFIYVQNSRRPSDSKYCKNSIKLSNHNQLQVIIKPSPKNVQKLYINSLEKIGINFKNNEIKFIEDNWENPTLGAWGVGWEIHLNGIEISQITYFQQIGGINCSPIILEITYGLERLAMITQNVKSIYEILWDRNSLNKKILYKDLFYNNELEQSYYNCEFKNEKFIFIKIKNYETEILNLINLNKKPLLVPAYECLLKMIHNFNIIEAKNLISIYERQYFILKIQNLSKKIAKIYFKLHNS